MIHALNDIVGLPSATSSTEIAHAADLRAETLFSRASGGDSDAQRALVELQCAYLVWAYASPKAGSTAIYGNQAGA
jgi:hypothetical protein